MHVQIINFTLTGISESDYAALCDQLAPAFAALPGLMSKVWLADSDNGVFGGVYVWESAAAMEAFTGSDLFAAVSGHPNLAGISSRDFGVLTGPTATTSNLHSLSA